MPEIEDDKVIVGYKSGDDAAVYRISDTEAIVQTLDFFTPIVDDPYQYGAIAAANALSDVYAMGAKPLFALNIMGFPINDLEVEVAQQILRGGSDKAHEAGIHIIGGHSIDDKEPKYGLAVTAIVDIDRLIRIEDAKPGDALILTKPLGTGIISTAIKRKKASLEVIAEAIRVMVTLNKNASLAMVEAGANACTDITGFGLMGHLLELTRASSVTAELWVDEIPVIPGAVELIEGGAVPGGTRRNLKYVSEYSEFDPEIASHEKIILADAQTSGGLLIAIPDEGKSELLNLLEEKGVEWFSKIGRLVERGTEDIIVIRGRA